MAVQEREYHALNADRAPNPDIERIYVEWDKALSRNDAEAILALYAPDAVLESPLVCHLLNRDEGICRGHAELRKLFEILAARKPKVRQFHRTGYFTDGRTILWEYPRATPGGEQMDFVEVMEIQDGLIQKHRVYWGWFGFNVLKKDQYRQ
jgi:ketosteroid isomerase-like protein